MWKFLTLALVVAGFVVFACGPSGTAGAQCMDQTGAAVNGTIQVATEGSGCGTLSGTVPPGGACSSGTLNPQESVEVAYCNAGTCATANDTCCTFQVSEMSADAGNRSCQ
jgi:hypothetical protein